MILDLTPFELVIVESALKHRPFVEKIEAPATRRQIRDTYKSALEKVREAGKGAAGEAVS